MPTRKGRKEDSNSLEAWGESAERKERVPGKR